MAERQGFVSYYLDGAFRRMAYRAFGRHGAPVVLCVHGLTRNGRDFDALAEALADRFEVIAVDLPGRGASDWIGPMRYATPFYVMALSALLAQLRTEVFYVGTSLGGICGMELAAAGHSPIRKLVLNDVGALVPKAALQRIKEYVCAPPPAFPDLEAMRLYLRRVHAPFGPLSGEQWRKMAVDSARLREDGSIALHYDPGIAAPYAAFEVGDLDLSAFWQGISVPVLVLRGESSDVLPADVYEKMLEKAQGITVERCGHAPALLDEATISAIGAFLDA